MENQNICHDCEHHGQPRSADVCDDCFVRQQNYKFPRHYRKKMDTPKLEHEVRGLMTAPGYERLAAVLHAAYNQAAHGKGKERHANALPFHEQPMQQIARRRGIGFILGQADKKTEEAQGMLERGDVQAWEREILGAIVYLAGAIIHIQDKQKGTVCK